MKWFQMFAQLLPAVFSIVPALQAHQQTAVDAGKTIGDAAALGPLSRSALRATVSTLVRDGVTVANDELVAAGKPALDHAAIASAASEALETAIAVTDIVHAAHGEGDAPAHPA